MDLYIAGDIDEDAFVKFSEELAELETNKNRKSVVVTLLSNGGDADVALAFFDRIQSSKLEITVKGTGIVASAAVLVLAAGHHRILTKNSWVMLHEESVGDVEGMRVAELENLAYNLRQKEDRWADILSQVTNAEWQKWEELHKTEKFLTAKQCLELGLIEEIR